jgi:hypothetical protein
MRRFGKELLIAGGVTLCMAFAFSGLSRLPALSPVPAKLDVEMPRRSSEPPAMVERRMPPPADVAAAAGKDRENGAKASVGKRAATGPTPPAANTAAAIPAPVPRPDPQRAPADLASGERPTDIRSEAQRIADERQREEGLWQRMARTATTLNEMIPGRKMVAQAVDTVRDGVNDLINVLR